MWDASGLGWRADVETILSASVLDEAHRHERFEQVEGGSWISHGPIMDDALLLSDCFYISGRNGHTEIARLLEQRGADVNFRGFFGGTALHWAAINGHRVELNVT